MKLLKAAGNDYLYIKNLYNTAFPFEERAPFFIIKRKAMQGLADMLIAEEDQIPVGFAYVVSNEQLAYLFYFAVDENKRGVGNGSKILQLLKEKYHGKKLFLARERLDEKNENMDQRIERHNFYLKNGFIDQRSHIREGNVIYDVMSVGEHISSSEYDELITSWSGKLFRHIIKMKLTEY